MKVIGITGPSGSGKTTLSKILTDKYNTIIIDADAEAKKLSNDTSTEYYKEIVNLFGKESLKENNQLNRKKIATIIYNNKEKKEALDKLTFKYVVDEINKQIENYKKENYKYLAIDVPLLYEAKMEGICNYVIAVIADDNEKIERICKRDNITKELAQKRLEIQNKNEFYTQKANFIIHNNGSIKDLENSIEEIINKI